MVTNNVLLVKIEGPVWYTSIIYQSTNQWEKDIYDGALEISHLKNQRSELDMGQN